MSSINNSELSDFTFGQDFQDAAHENNIIINNLNSFSIPYHQDPQQIPNSHQVQVQNEQQVHQKAKFKTSIKSKPKMSIKSPFNPNFKTNNKPNSKTIYQINKIPLILVQN